MLNRLLGGGLVLFLGACSSQETSSGDPGPETGGQVGTGGALGTVERGGAGGSDASGSGGHGGQAVGGTGGSASPSGGSAGEGGGAPAVALDGSFSKPELVARINVDLVEHALTIDGGENLLVVFATGEYEGLNGIHWTESSGDGVWSTPADAVPPRGDVETYFLDVVRSNDGAACASYRLDSQNSLAYFDGTAWSEQPMLERPFLAATGSGCVAVAAQTIPFSLEVLEHSGSDWLEPETLEFAELPERTYIQHAVGLPNDGVLLMLQSERSLWTLERADGAWRDPVPLGEIRADWRHSALTVGPDGSVFALWTTDHRALVARTRDASGVWGDTQTIDLGATPERTRVRALHATTTAAGAIATFVNTPPASTAESGDVFAIHYAPGGWKAAELVATARTEAPRVSADAQGNALFFWDDIDEAAAVRYIAGQGYSAKVRVAGKDDITTPFRPPALVSTSDGGYWMMWLVSYDNALYAARFTPSP